MSSMKCDKMWSGISAGSRRRGGRSKCLTRRSFFRGTSTAATFFNSVISDAMPSTLLVRKDDVN